MLLWPLFLTLSVAIVVVVRPGRLKTMCECLEPVRCTNCGQWAQFLAIRGSYDVYGCPACGRRFDLYCKMEDLGPAIFSMRYALEKSLKGGELVVQEK